MGEKLYDIIYEDIKEKIESGQLMYNDQLPTEAVMCSEYRVSKVTVRRALNILLNEGYIEAIPRVGYFVKKPEKNVLQLFYNEKAPILDKIDEIETSPPQIMDDLSRLKSISPLLKNIRGTVILKTQTFKSYTIPIAYDEKYLFKRNSSKELKHYDNYFEDSLFLFAEKIDLTLDAQTSNLDIQQKLDSYRKIPILIAKKVYYDKYDRLFAFSRTFYHGHHAKITALSP
ncbi:GntR family transcriptional regulator [Eubacterium callanderi]|uniref:GntR family transcriptional regulator n=1 Tax=Eubacterium callanderi TaxID=53442 RepID=UPI001C2CF88F|nr:GntR family transcriptional regulator [Eubacterium callanderi]MBV1684103.1 GntR family transcriptional regulator [Eubacterium callanderi]